MNSSAVTKADIYTIALFIQVFYNLPLHKC